MQAVDGSLSRLGTDYVDILYLHIDDYNTPLDETLGALADVIGRGKVRYFGVSNFAAWRIAEVVHTCADMGLIKPVVCQPNYSAVNRLPRRKSCRAAPISESAWRPIARSRAGS